MKMNKFLEKLSYVLQGKRKAVLGILILFLFISALEMLGTGLVGPFIAIATSPKSIQTNSWLKAAYQSSGLANEYQFLVAIGIIIITIFYIKSYASFSAQKRIFEFGFKQQGELASWLMRAYLAAPYTFHLSRNSASIIQNITSETERFCNGFLMPLLTCISNSVITLALVILLIKTSAMAMIIIAGILLLAFTLFYYSKDKIARLGKEGSEGRTEMIRLIHHSLGGLKETRVIGCEPYFSQQMQQETRRYALGASTALSLSNLPRYAIEAVLITFLVGFTILFITLNQTNADELNSVLGVFALASIRLLPALSSLVTSVNGIRYNSNSLDKIYFDLKELDQFDSVSTSKLENLPVEPHLVDKNITIPFGHSIKLESIEYQYPAASKGALQGVSLEIRKGESIALIGKSGAGKTTLVDVILGLLKPQSGDIKVDGISIYQDLRAWQNMIGYVPQSIFLIDDTLEKNIAFGIPDHLISPERLDKAIQASQLSELIENLPQGIKTQVGERGIMLSGGQRQRVGIARALYHGREILVFDEATAALDNETESLVTQSIESLSGTKTMIIIAHRLTTVEKCDHIYVMEKGCIAKSGSYQTVVLGE